MNISEIIERLESLVQEYLQLIGKLSSIRDVFKEVGLSKDQEAEISNIVNKIFSTYYG